MSNRESIRALDERLDKAQVAIDRLIKEVVRLRDRVSELETNVGSVEDPSPLTPGVKLTIDRLTTEVVRLRAVAAEPSKPIQSAWSESERVSPSGEEYGLPKGDAALIIGNMMREGAIRTGKPSPISEALNAELKAAAEAFRARDKEEPEE